jgi:TATA-box binding protein (TBP) (component of TFIID and TFIIIB)
VISGSDIDLRTCARAVANFEFPHEGTPHGLMRLRNPKAACTVFSNGTMSVIGMKTETVAKIALRKCARKIQKVIPTVKFLRFNVVNVRGSARCPFEIHLESFADDHIGEALYEPELDGVSRSALSFAMREPKADFTVYHTGTIQGTARSRGEFYQGMDLIYPIVENYRKDRIFK